MSIPLFEIERNMLMAEKKKKRDDGRYQKSITFEGKRYYVYASNKKELDEKVLLKLQELKDRKTNHDNPTLDKYYESFTTLRRSKVKESTIRNQTNWYHWAADTELDGLRLGDMRIRDITSRDMKLIQKALIDDHKLSASSINDALHHVSHVFSDAVKDETILRNPCSCLSELARESDKPKAEDTIHRALEEDETKLFLDTARNSFFINGFRLMLQSGIRIGELGALTAADFDFKSGFLIISKTVSRGEINSYVVNPTPKTETSNRRIYMNDNIKQIFKDQQSFLRQYFGLQYKGRLFPDPEGGLLMDTSFNREIKRITDLMGIDKITSHAFRSTFATRFIEQRPHDYKALSEILGHSDVKITLNLYAKVMAKTKQKAMEEIQIAM